MHAGQYQPNQLTDSLSLSLPPSGEYEIRYHDSSKVLSSFNPIYLIEVGFNITAWLKSDRLSGNFPIRILYNIPVLSIRMSWTQQVRGWNLSSEMS